MIRGEGMKYVVKRDCCLDGYCINCWPFPRRGRPPWMRKKTNNPNDGTRLRWVQFETDDKVRAEKVAENWANYRATVERTASS